ncbi:hypothetical protein B5181_00095 [Streptomyces sp. 4F]|nr:hypothetical protein B5181_00095 [Streptomyces sp. 4F]
MWVSIRPKPTRDLPVPDPITAQSVLPAKPAGEGEEAGWPTQETVRSGDRLPPEALEIELDPGRFGTFPGVRPHRCP